MSENPQEPQPPQAGEPHRPPYPQQPYPQQPYGQQPGQQPYGQQSYEPQPYGQQPGQPPIQPPPDPGLYPGNEYPPDRSARPAPGAGSFLGALFDYSFTRYITPTIVKVVYVIVTILVALAWLFGIVAAFQVSVGVGIGYLLLAWIVALVYLALARITLEFFVAVINVSEKVNRYAERDGVS
ncbi:hypothetical protein GCM10009809_36680 [Isoptericola hypogeus]|uniref:DUF4282 domain-containing protein n=1 Tax=Isoptericola hypogeus TaxID=300179 RepID=A0ABP4VUA9_9MICO